MGAQDYFVYSDTCEGRDLDFTHVVNKECLKSRSEYKIVFNSLGQQKIILNFDADGDATYDSTKYGLDIGSYIIENIPDKYPLAIINHDISDSIQYTGENLINVNSKYE